MQANAMRSFLLGIIIEAVGPEGLREVTAAKDEMLAAIREIEGRVGDKIGPLALGLLSAELAVKAEEES